jgi:hypothetical protein
VRSDGYYGTGLCTSAAGIGTDLKSISFEPCAFRRTCVARFGADFGQLGSECGVPHDEAHRKRAKVGAIPAGSKEMFGPGRPAGDRGHVFTRTYGFFACRDAVPKREIDFL